LLKGKTPGKRGYFTYRKVAVPLYDSFGNVIDNDWDIQDIEFIEDSGGYVTLHTMPEVKYNSMGDVIAKAPYVLGGDTAGTGEDFYAAKVINAMTDKTVATLHKQHIAEDLYAEQLYCLGKLYHDALISVEINYSQEPMRLIYQRFNYRNVFVRRRLSGMADETVRDVGFETTRKTKPIIIGDLIEIMRRVPDAECDVATLKEMLTFVESERERYAAIVGCHDDLVMALAIAHNAKSQQRLTWIECGGERDTFIEDNFVFSASGTTEKYISWEDI
jgi:phage terminase large subunit